MGNGTIKEFIKAMLYFAIVMLIMALMVIPFIIPTSREFTIVLMVLIINISTIVGAIVYLCVAGKKQNNEIHDAKDISPDGKKNISMALKGLIRTGLCKKIGHSECKD